MLQGLEGPWSEAPPCGLQGLCERRNAQGLPKEEVLGGQLGAWRREGRVASADATPQVTALTGEVGRTSVAPASADGQLFHGFPAR